MIAKDIISYYIPAVKISASGDDALALMDEHKLNHLPIVDGTKYEGIVSEDLLLELDDSSLSIKELKLNLFRPYVNVYSHIFDVVKLFCEFKITSIPVLDDSEEYLGLITIQDLAFQLAKITNSNEPGGVLILSVNVRDYSLSQVAQIVESDNARVLSAYTMGSEDSMSIDIVLKINKSDLSAIIKSFLRFDYTIKASFHESSFDEDLQNRYDQFMRYLNT